MKSEVEKLKDKVNKLEVKIEEIFKEPTSTEADENKLDYLYYEQALAYENLDKARERAARQELEYNGRALPKHDCLDNVVLSVEDMDDLDDYYDYYDNCRIDEDWQKTIKGDTKMTKGKVSIVRTGEVGVKCFCDFCCRVRTAGYLVVDEEAFGVGSVEFFCSNCFEYLYGNTGW